MKRLEKNKWKFIWCGVNFQGINATKALAHVIGNMGMYIKSLLQILIKLIYQDINTYVI